MRHSLSSRSHERREKERRKLCTRDMKLHQRSRVQLQLVGTYTALRNRFSRKLKCDVGRGKRRLVFANCSYGIESKFHQLSDAIGRQFEKATSSPRRSRTTPVFITKKCIFNMHEERGAYIMLCAQPSIPCPLPKADFRRMKESEKDGWERNCITSFMLCHLNRVLCASLHSRGCASTKGRIYVGILDFVNSASAWVTRLLSFCLYCAACFPR